MEITLDIAATQPQGADVWVGIWLPLFRQTLRSRFENSSNYVNTLTNLTEERLGFFRKALKEVSKTLWTERAAAIQLI